LRVIRAVAAVQEQSEKQLEALALAAGQVIGDMEETPAIADVPLLCSAVLLRDEVIAMLEHKTETTGALQSLADDACCRPVVAMITMLVTTISRCKACSHALLSIMRSCM
jgi:altronate dehydratase